MKALTKYIMICSFALIATNIWSFVVVHKLYRVQDDRSPGIHVPSLQRLRSTTVRDGSAPLSDFGSQKRLYLLFVFSPFDCPASIEELAELEKLHEDRPSLDIRAIAFYESPAEVQQTVERFGLTFPMYADTDARFKTLLSPPQTPWKVVVDSDGQHIVFEDPPSVTPEEKSAFQFRASYLSRAFQGTLGHQ